MPFYAFWGILMSVHIPCASLFCITSKAIYEPFFRRKQTVLWLYVPQGLFLLHPRGDEGVWASNKLGCFRRCQHRRTFAPLGAYLDFQICNSCLADPNGFFLSWAWNFLCWEDSVRYAWCVPFRAFLYVLNKLASRHGILSCFLFSDGTSDVSVLQKPSCFAFADM